MGNCFGTDAVKDQQNSNGHSTGRGTMHDGILRERTSDVYEKYTEVEVLGRGSMGHVAKVQVKEGQEGGSAFQQNQKKPIQGQDSASTTLTERRVAKVDYALKSIQLDRVSPQFLEELKNEIDILKGMDHPNIVKAHEVYKHKKQIFLILELCDGGDLYTRLPYSERQAAHIVGKLCSAVKYMHDHGIVHRDLKFENIMFENKGEKAEIKVIDFGLSKKFLNNQIGIMHEGVGTLYSMSPQVLQGVYTSQADLWSTGVITYMLLSSHRPFYHKRRKIMIDRIMRCDYNFTKDYWAPVSDEAKDFINNLLVLDPKKRMNATKSLKHIWLSKEFKLSDRKSDQKALSNLEGNLLRFKEASSLKKIALQVVAKQSSTDEIVELRKCFDQFDTGNDGTISFDEFKSALRQAKYSEDQIKEIFDSIDVNKNGHIMYTEFIAAALETQGHIEEERVADAFDRLDSDDSGYISKQNLKDFLGAGATSKQIDDIINAADTNNDGQISYDEFLALFRKNKIDMIVEFSHLESNVSSLDEGDLVGLDAKIPGGRFDSTVS